MLQYQKDIRNIIEEMYIIRSDTFENVIKFKHFFSRSLTGQFYTSFSSTDIVSSWGLKTVIKGYVFDLIDVIVKCLVIEKVFDHWTKKVKKMFTGYLI